jgi:hypothetical protein
MYPILRHIDEELGPPPRRFSRDEWPDLAIPEPTWIRRDDMAIIYDDLRFLYKEGEIVWGAYVQANQLLFRRGFSNCPATFIYSRDPEIDDDPERLAAIATRLFQLKGGTWKDPDAQRYGDMLADERKRAMRWRAPETMTGDLPVYSTSVMVCRRHLPERVLASRYMPLLRHRDTVATLVVPHWFWPKPFRDRWAAAANVTAADQRWVTVDPRAAVWLRELAARDRMPPDWCLRIEVVRSEDGTRESTRWGIFADVNPERDRLFQVSGIQVAIKERFADELRGITIELYGEGKERTLYIY